MSFFRELTTDLRTAAQDFRTNGLDLDSLRVEVGNDKREPLPEPPPLGGKPKPIIFAEGETNHRDGQERRPQETTTTTTTTTQMSNGSTPSTNGAAAAKRVMGELFSADVSKVKAELETATRKYERSKARAQRYEAAAASYAADSAKLAARLEVCRSRSEAERDELEKLREKARRDAASAARSELERDACAAELEAVALRQVDALQAEVASLRRDKRRADALEAELETLRNATRVARSTETTDKKCVAELRAATLQLGAARSAAAASARAARAQIDVALQRARQSETDLGKARLEVAELRAKAVKAGRERDEALRSVSHLEQASSRAARRGDDADALRQLSREALASKSKLETELATARRDLDRLEELKRATDAKAATDAERLRGELAAARAALRDARQALVDRGGGSSSSGDLELLPDDSNEDDARSTASSGSLVNLSSSGAAEYLRNVVRTALPSTPRGDDASTRARLVPVLRSLLALPHDVVAKSLDALARTHGGGDFALGLLLAAAKATDKIVSPAEAAREQDAVARRIEIAHDLDLSRAEVADLRRALDEKTAELRHLSDTSQQDLAAAAEDRARLERTYQARAQDALHAVEATDARSRALEAEARAAYDAAETALRRHRDLETQLAEFVQRRQAGLDPEQLDYLRGTLVFFLKGYATPHVRKQMVPVLLKVLKLQPDDPRTLDLLAINDADADPS